MPTIAPLGAVRVVPHDVPPEMTAIPVPAGYVIGNELDNVPAENDNPVPTVTLLNPPEPLPKRIDDPEVAGALLLNVVQSVDDRAPRLVADAVGTFNVMTGVVVPVVTDDDKSVPVVPMVKAATLVTVPLPLPLNVFQSVDVR